MTDSTEVQEVNDTEMTTEDIASQLFDELESEGVEEVKEVAEVVEETTEDATEKTEKVDEPEKAEKTEEEKPEAITAPDEWNSELKEAFAKQTDEGKDALVKAHKNMYSDYQRDKQALTQEKQAFEPIKEASQDFLNHFSRHEQVLRAKGVNPSKYMAETVKWLDGLIHNPQQTLNDLNKEFGHDPDNQPYVSPEQEQINKLQAQLDQFNQNTQQQQMQQQTANQKAEQVDAENAFRTAENADGSQKHPHFDDPEVRATIDVLAAREIHKLYQQGKSPQDLTPEEKATAQETFYKEAVRIAGKEVTANKAIVEKPQRIKATAPVESNPSLSTEQITAREYERMMQGA